MSNVVEFNIGAAQVKLPADVVMKNFLDSLQQSPIELPVLNSVRTFKIGTHHDEFGGIFVGELRDENGAPYSLFIPTHKDGYNESVAWGSQGEDEPGAKSRFDGHANTIALCESRHEHPAAEWAREVTIDGFNDFYLPSLRELMLCFVNVPELFEDGWYWSSTQYSASYAYMQHFGDGYTDVYYKDFSDRARVVRRFVSPLTI